MDIKGAYLNRKMVEELYMKQPTGFEDGTAWVCRLHCKIYGLQQAGNVWNHEWGWANVHPNMSVPHVPIWASEWSIWFLLLSQYATGPDKS